MGSNMMSSPDFYSEFINTLGEANFNYSTYISLKFRFIYFENAKCGCTSIKKSLFQHELSDHRLGAQIKAKFLENVHNNIYGCPMIKPFQLGKLYFNELCEDPSFTRFTSIRSPYVGLLSGYLDKVKRNQNAAKQIYDVTGSTQVSFKEFLLALVKLKNDKIPFDKHWRPMHLSVLNGKIDNLLCIDIDNFSADADNVNSTIGAPVLLEQRHTSNHNTNSKDLLTSNYDEEALSLIESLYELDFKIFGYDKVRLNQL